MCNGDLGMYRVMPWAYPTISGGSSGGVTTDPTPDPEPTPADPYDFSGATFTIRKRTVSITKTTGFNYCRFYLDVANIVTIDTSRVSSVMLRTDNIADLSFNPTGTNKEAVDDNARDINNINTGNWGWMVYYPASTIGNSTIVGTPHITISVYDAAGNVIQEYKTDVSG